ncbi:MAG: hypothetical protein AUH72_07685 [Acidobacteria bacterium 13_1_40CM_4_65_8]|nr:MAG: hypothetical protein AUH72_07685 [Acidobacteria bacterium 13_1_40CM_4_65_8]
MDGVGSATLVRGSDEPSDVLFVANPSRESAIPGGAPPDVMRSYMFFPSHVFYTSPGCWQFTVRVGHEEFHIVRELKALGAAVDGHPSGQSAESLSRDGNVVIKMVDDRRVLIAVDTTNEGRPEDGQIDHLFLFTASESIQLPSNVNSGADISSSPARRCWSNSALGHTCCSPFNRQRRLPDQRQARHGSSDQSACPITEAGGDSR